MSLKVCVFVDGESLRHTLAEFLADDDRFKMLDYLPGEANWEQFFDLIAETAVRGHIARRLRTYWYVVDELDIVPCGYKTLLAESPFMLKNALGSDYYGRLQLADPKKLTERLEKICDELDASEQIIRQRFDRW